MRLRVVFVLLAVTAAALAATAVALILWSQRDGQSAPEGPLAPCDLASVRLDAFVPWPGTPLPVELDAKSATPCRLEGELSFTVDPPNAPGAPRQPLDIPGQVHVTRDLRGSDAFALGWLTVTNWCGRDGPMIHFNLDATQITFPDPEHDSAHPYPDPCRDRLNALTTSTFEWVPWDESAPPRTQPAGP